MAQARRKSSGGRSGRGRRWLTLLLGVGIGIACVVLFQFVEKRWHAKDGIASLFKAKPAEVKKAEPEKKEPEPAKTAKPKYDFYTILPETETLLPDRGARARPDKAAKPEKSEEGVNYILQAGSFGNYKDADELKAKLALSGLVAHIQRISIEGRGDYYRVRLGPYTTLDKLEAAEQQLRQLGLGKPMALKVKKGAG
jgi:cell division protein FtsN